MKRHHFLTLLLASFFVLLSFHGIDVYAQNSISGDDVCGGLDNECKFQDFTKVFRGIFSLIISIGLPALVVFILYRIIVMWYALAMGTNPNAIKEAGQKVTNAILGFIIVIAIAGGIFLTILRYVGVKEPVLNLLKGVSELVVPHAYAATEMKCSIAPQGSSCISGYSSKQGLIVNKNATCLADGDPCTVNSSVGSYNVAKRECVQVVVSLPSRVSDCTGQQEGVPCSGTGLTLDPNGVCKSVVVLDKVTAQSPPSVTDSSVPSSVPSGDSGKLLPNPTGITSLYDFILSVLNMVMKFFIYPALIAMWTWTGFSYVLAQGAPDKLMKAHKLLLWAVISTLVIFMTQGFLTAVRGSVQKIFPNAKVSQEIRVESLVVR